MRFSPLLIGLLAFLVISSSVAAKPKDQTDGSTGHGNSEQHRSDSDGGKKPNGAKTPTPVPSGATNDHSNSRGNSGAAHDCQDPANWDGASNRGECVSDAAHERNAERQAGSLETESGSSTSANDRPSSPGNSAAAHACQDPTNWGIGVSNHGECVSDAAHELNDERQADQDPDEDTGDDPPGQTGDTETEPQPAHL